jgi:uncharacterized protein YbjT (DUF2867 family)
MVRNASKFAGTTADEVIEADARNPATLPAALDGVETAYYLIHSMSSSNEFAEEDRRAAEHFGAAAKAAGVSRLIYLGGLGHGEQLSHHLLSRQETGDVLRQFGVPVIEFRAAVVIGNGSASYEIIRMLVRRLPVMTTPKWVRTKTQPIAVDDLLRYLVEAMDLQCDGHRVYEIGGADQVTYEDLFREYAKQRGKRRWIIPVSVLSPRLSSYWLALITPVHARVGRQLIDGLRNETVVKDDSALRHFAWRPMGMVEAIQRAGE